MCKGLLLQLITFSDTHTHAQTHTRARLDSSRRRIGLSLRTKTTQNTNEGQPRPQRDSNPQSQQANGRRPSLTPRGHRDRPFSVQLTMFLRLCADLLLGERVSQVFNIGTYSLYKLPPIPREKSTD